MRGVCLDNGTPTQCGAQKIKQGADEGETTTLLSGRRIPLFVAVVFAVYLATSFIYNAII
jgi:hypothetical protein